MSPEQAAGDLGVLGPRSDVYSLGATLSCLLAGKPPFEGDDPGAILRAVQRGEFPPPRQLDPSIDRWPCRPTHSPRFSDGSDRGEALQRAVGGRRDDDEDGASASSRSGGDATP